MMTEEAIKEQLKTIIDPEMHINIVDLGLIYGITINQEKKEVIVTMTLTSPGCPLSMVFEEWIPAAVKQVEGVETVVLDLVWDPPWDPNNISEDAREELGMYF